MVRKTRKKSLSATQQRKKDHLELCLDTEAVTAPYGTGLNDYAFVHNALPEVDLDEIDLPASFLGKPLRAPLLISSMTVGFDLAGKVDRKLAQAAQHLGLGMGVGSHRVAIALCGKEMLVPADAVIILEGYITERHEDAGLWYDERRAGLDVARGRLW